MTLAADPRTIILGDDGRFVTVGRLSAPSEGEIAAAGAALAAQGVGGWLATMSDSIYRRRCPDLVMLREIAPPRRSWDEAVAAFRSTRAGR